MCTLVLGHPRTMAKLDQRDERVEQTGNVAQLVQSLRGLLHARMELQQDAAQLPRRLERRERLAELREGALARIRLLVSRHLLRGLRMERESGGRPLGPARGRLRRRKAVEGRV